MKHCLITILLSLVMMGCGSGPVATSTSTRPASAATPTPIVTPNVSGPVDNWFLTTTSGLQIAAAFHITNTTISGGLRISPNSPCFPPEDVYYVSGTVDAQGFVSAKAQLDQGTFSFSGYLNGTRSSLSAGRYFFENGCAQGDSGSLTAIKIPPVNGVYTGTLNSSISSVAITATLNQLPEFGSGSLEVQVNGNIKFTSPTCTKDLPASGSISGTLIKLAVFDGYQDSWVIGGRVNPDGTRMTIADYDGSCGGGGTGELVRQ
jgi:hypothetical protein